MTRPSPGRESAARPLPRAIAAATRRFSVRIPGWRLGLVRVCRFFVDVGGVRDRRFQGLPGSGSRSGCGTRGSPSGGPSSRPPVARDADDRGRCPWWSKLPSMASIRLLGGEGSGRGGPRRALAEWIGACWRIPSNLPGGRVVR